MRIWLYRFVPPRTLNSKIRYRMFYDRNPLLTTFCDRWAVREYVAGRVGSEVLVQVHALVSDPEDLDVDDLPDRCVIKPTHGSGAVIFVDDRSDPAQGVPHPDPGVAWTTASVRIQKGQLRSKSFTALARSWLSAVYGRDWEPAYRAVPPQLIVEELLETEDGSPPPDFKFWCIHGIIRFIQVDVDRFTSHRREILSRQGRSLSATILYDKPDQSPESPKNLPDLIAVAEALAAGIDFVRVDLYSVGGAVKFGELTDYPGGGNEAMRPNRLFTRLAAEWRPHLEYGPYLFRRHP